jgi:hypothetical protein
MTKKPDAIKGIKHVQEETLLVEKSLGPFEHHTPPDIPGGLSVRVYNMSQTKTYVLRLYEVVESVKMPKHGSKS